MWTTVDQKLINNIIGNGPVLSSLNHIMYSDHEWHFNSYLIHGVNASIRLNETDKQLMDDFVTFNTLAAVFDLFILTSSRP